MSLVYFERTFAPCIVNPVTFWHLEHGWIWNIIDRRSNSPLGVLYATLICGDGAVLHFETAAEKVPFAYTLSAMRRAVALLAKHCPLMLATIPQHKVKLIRCVQRIGFRAVTVFERDGVDVAMLQFFVPEK